MEQLENHAGNGLEPKKLHDKHFFATKQGVIKQPLFVDDFFYEIYSKNHKMAVKEALNIDQYWARVEFTPVRG